MTTNPTTHELVGSQWYQNQGFHTAGHLKDSNIKSLKARNQLQSVSLSLITWTEMKLGSWESLCFGYLTKGKVKGQGFVPKFLKLGNYSCKILCQLSEINLPANAKLLSGLNSSTNLVSLSLLVHNTQSDRNKNFACFREQLYVFLVYISTAACQINPNFHFCISNFARKLLGRQVFMCLICRLL